MIANQKGFGKMDILIAVIVALMLVIGLEELLRTQSASDKALAQKMEILALRQNITVALNDPQTCACHFSSPNGQNPNLNDRANLKFDASAKNPSLSLSAIYGGCLPNPGQPRVEAGKPLPNTKTGLEVDRIEVVDLTPSGASHEWQGFLQVSFKTDSLVVARQPLRIPQHFVTETGTADAATVIRACVAVGEDAPMRPHVYDKQGAGFFKVPAGVNVLRVEVWGGGGGSYGGGGAFCSFVVGVSAGTQFGYYVGGGGLMGAAGEDSGFGNLCIAGGGLPNSGAGGVVKSTLAPGSFVAINGGTGSASMGGSAGQGGSGGSMSPGVAPGGGGGSKRNGAGGRLVIWY